MDCAWAASYSHILSIQCVQIISFSKKRRMRVVIFECFASVAAV